MVQTAEGPLLHEATLQAVEHLAENMNRQDKDYVPVAYELRRLFDKWRATGPNASSFLLKEKVFEDATKIVRTKMVATCGATAKLRIQDCADLKLDHLHFIAWSLFTSFLLNPFNECLCGPCAGCGKYFVNSTKRKNRVYCSSPCGNRVTSREANRGRRRADKQGNLHKVNEAIRAWRRAKPSVPWKEWVSRKTHVSKNWLTRAANNGGISDPEAVDVAE